MRLLFLVAAVARHRLCVARRCARRRRRARGRRHLLRASPTEFGWPRWKRRSRTSGRASRRRSTTRRSWARTCCSCAWPLGLRRSGLYRHGTGRHEWHDVAVGLAAMGLAPQSSKTPICPACASLPCPHLCGCASLAGVGFSMRGFSMRTAQCTQLFASGRRCMCRAAKYSCTNCLSSMCAWIWTGNG